MASTATVKMLGLSERQARQEQADRLWKWLTIGMALALVSLLLMGQVQSGQTMKVMEAEKFIIRDRAGVVRGELSTDRDDSPKLWLLDKAGIRRAELSLLADGTPGLRLLDEHEMIRVSVAILESRPALTLRDNEGRDRVKLVVLPDGEPYLQLRDKSGSLIWSTPSHSLEVRD